MNAGVILFESTTPFLFAFPIPPGVKTYESTRAILARHSLLDKWEQFGKRFLSGDNS